MTLESFPQKEFRPKIFPRKHVSKEPTAEEIKAAGVVAHQKEFAQGELEEMYAIRTQSLEKQAKNQSRGPLGRLIRKLL